MLLTLLGPLTVVETVSKYIVRNRNEHNIKWPNQLNQMNLWNCIDCFMEIPLMDQSPDFGLAMCKSREN